MIVTAAKVRDSDRWLKARLDLVVASLPLSIVLNPIWSALFLIPFGGSLPAFGHVSLGIMLTVVAMNAASGTAAHLVNRWVSKSAPAPHRLLRVLLKLQLISSSCWAIGAVLCWVDGNSANNILVALIVVANMWALAITRSHHPLLFTAGLLSMMLILWLRAIFGSGDGALALTMFTPIFSAYAWSMGASQRDRIDQLLRARFAVEDMASALEAARNEALANGAEAEAASVSKSAFVANMSHELRTPLNAILGFAEIIHGAAVGPEVSAQYRSYAGDIHQSGSHLLSLINDMLNIAKIESGKMEIERRYIDVRQVIAGAVRLVAQRAEQAKQTIAIEVGADVRPFIDERAFKQILLNLLSNAIKFSPEGGAIGVSCRSGPDGAVLLCVADCGPGIPEEKIRTLFRPFSRVDNRYDRSENGTGLGLALVHGLVGLHDGRVWLRNKVGGGLEVFVEFSAREARAA